MSRPYSIVATDPKTGREVKNPKTYQNIRFALKTPAGRIAKIKDAPVQAFAKIDLLGLNKTISGSQRYIVYEQLTNRHMVDKNGEKIAKVDRKGNIIYRSTKSGKKVPVYYREKKFTFFRKTKEQRPVLYNKTKRQRELEIGFKKLSPRQQADQKIATFVKPNEGLRLSYTITGESVREAMSNLILDIDKRDVYGKDGKKIAGLYYNIVTYITDPKGDTIRIPSSGSIASMEKFKDVFPSLMFRTYPDEPAPAFSKEVRTLANINREIAWTVSSSLSRVGYVFTAPKDLNIYGDQMSANAADMRAKAHALLKSGKKNEAKKKFESEKRILEARKKMFREKKNKKFLERGKYEVKIIIDFETIPV